MNTIGKILVILNFLFAIVLGGFLIMYSTRSTNWKNSYDDLKKEMDALKLSRDSANQFASSTSNREKQSLTKIEDLKKELSEKQAELNTKIDELSRINGEKITDLKLYDLKLQKAVAEVERLKTEVTDRDKTIEEREKAINITEVDRNKYRQDAVFLESQNRTIRNRNEQLADSLSRTETELHRLRAGGGSGAGGGAVETVSVKLTNEPNPPPVHVKGRVEKIAPNSAGLVELSLGSDQGLNKNHTLWAYRTSRPEATYLGMIRIVEVYPTRSVGRLVGSSQSLQEGDRVTSDWNR